LRTQTLFGFTNDEATPSGLGELTPTKGGGETERREVAEGRRDELHRTDAKESAESQHWTRGARVTSGGCCLDRRTQGRAAVAARLFTQRSCGIGVDERLGRSLVVTEQEDPEAKLEALELAMDSL